MRGVQFVLAACVAAMAAAPASAGVLGSAQVSDCLQTADGLNCDEKTLTTFSVSYGLSATADFVVSAPGDPPLEAVARLELSKSQPTVTYPLIYHHTVEYLPRNGLGELLFDGYRIGEPVTDYRVQGTVTQGQVFHEFQLRPAEPIHDTAGDPGIDGVFPLRAELAGDFAAYKGLPELDNFILYIAASPEGHPLVEEWQKNMLLVPREEVSYEGTECDKVGYIPRTRFARKYGLCLRNQLFDKHNADLALLTQNPNAETTYLVSGMRAFKRTRWLTSGSGQRLISYEPPEIQRTQVVVTTDRADEITLIAAESAGIIQDAAAVLDPFASHSRDGSLSVEIQNIGDLRADYIVEVTNCNSNIVEAIPAQARTLGPQQEATLFFDLYTTSNSDTANACTVALVSPTGKRYDRVETIFDTAVNPAP